MSNYFISELDLLNNQIAMAKDQLKRLRGQDFPDENAITITAKHLKDMQERRDLAQ